MAVSSHLDESMHVFGNGTTARLMVTPWTRDTVADGYWQNTNTIRPLSARDVYLAECIDKLSASQVAYNAGPGIAITPSDTSPNQYIISYNPDTDNYKETTYKFDNGITASVPDPYTNVITVGLKVDQRTITVNDNGLSANLEGIAARKIYANYNTEKVTYDYKYGLVQAHFESSTNIPSIMEENVIYLIG